MRCCDKKDKLFLGRKLFSLQQEHGKYFFYKSALAETYEYSASRRKDSSRIAMGSMPSASGMA